MATGHNTIDHATLRHLVEAGAVRGAEVIGQSGGWGIIIKYGVTERTLAARRGTIRVFTRLEALVNYLKNIGICQFSIDASTYDPAEKKRARPDASKRLKSTFESADYDKWFREQVEEGIREADDPATTWVSDEEAKAMSAQYREKLLQQLHGVVQ